jgi:hypothetical protein
MIHWNIYDIENIFSVVKVMGLQLPLIKYIQLQRVGVVLDWDITLQRKNTNPLPWKINTWKKFEDTKRGIEKL